MIFKIQHSEACIVDNSLEVLRRLMQNLHCEGWKVVSHTWVTAAEYYDGYWSVYAEKGTTR